MLIRNQTRLKNVNEKTAIGGNVIIQCPKCQTRFAVNSELISELDMPRFHCSRCDNVFETASATDTNKAQAQQSEHIDEPTFIKKPHEEPTNIPLATNISAGLVAASITQENISAQETETSVSETEPSPNLGSSNSRSLRIPKDIDENLTHTPPHETSSAQEYEQLAMNLSTPNLSTPNLSTPNLSNPSLSTQRSSSLIQQETSSQEENKDSSSDMPYGVTIIEPKIPEFATNMLKVDSKPYPTPNSEELLKSLPNAFANNSYSSTKRSGLVNGSFIFIAPILASLVIISCFSYFLISSPKLVEALTQAIPNTLPRLAPPGMRLERLKYSTSNLESGEQVNIISGKLINDSQESFNEVIIEGLAFNESGQLLKNIKIHSGNNLANANITSLPLERILSLQEEGKSKKRSIKPGEQEDFILAFIDKADLEQPHSKLLASAKYFSARIYSVK
jgi:predicted Zn finger-like uncharacterized protein